ncbi:serine protease persephone isoform X2 [Drosophila busckii]|uniref:serine protease persephone isoform X2 n=1 Tax=Drosophila busckii TaxID=30019 RepID=UPI00083F3E85|nr:serine protease persephone isoform X2 [Drosophila busckii]
MALINPLSNLNYYAASLLICALMLCQLEHSEAREGDSCIVKENMPGICRLSSKCEPHIEKYIKSGRLSQNEVPSCGFGPREEIVCCPVAECCDDEDTGPSQVTTAPITRTTTEPSTKALLDPESSYFDLHQMLTNGARSKDNSESKPQRMEKSQKLQLFQDMGPLGAAAAPTAARDRTPKIINRPPIFINRPPSTTPMTLVKLVNDRLQQRGMNIVPAQQVNSFNPATTTAAPIIEDPWEPFYFRENLDAIINGTTSTTTTTTTTTTVRALPATPTTRVDTGAMEERPAVRACRKIEARDKVESITYQILGGLPVDPGVYPHMAAIAFSNFGSFSYRCGGTLISNRHVLTAAHCVNSQNDTPVHVRLGSVNIENLSSYYQDIAVTDNIVVHPDYVSSTKYHDIAILELEHEVNLTYYVYPACLDASASDPPTNSQLYVAGWGVMNQTTRRTSKVLLRAPLSVVPLSQCNEAYLEQPNSKRFLPNGLIPSLLCAADKLQQKADACQGDSGGPLVLEEDIVNHKYSIVGVISAGFGCATKTPGLYTRVSSYLDFIESVVWPNNVV